MTIIILLCAAIAMICFIGYKEIVRRLNLSTRQKIMLSFIVFSIPLLEFMVFWIIANLFQK